MILFKVVLFSGIRYSCVALPLWILPRCCLDVTLSEHFFWTITIVAAVVNRCANDEWRCYSGGCIQRELVCDGQAHCTDGSDEHSDHCGGKFTLQCVNPYSVTSHENLIWPHRARSQAIRLGLSRDRSWILFGFQYPLVLAEYAQEISSTVTVVVPMLYLFVSQTRRFATEPWTAQAERMKNSVVKISLSLKKHVMCIKNDQLPKAFCNHCL